MDLFKELELATQEHNEAERAESQARSVLTAAVNRLNAAQKAIDKAMADTRAKAPWNTDWWTMRNRGSPAETEGEPK